MSRSPNPGRCRFCEDPNPEAVCDWPELRIVRVRPVVVVPDDKIEQHGKLYRIESLEQVPEGIRITLENNAVGIIRFNDWLRVQRTGPCGAACCFRHRRHVAEDRDYCLDHRESWKAA